VTTLEALGLKVELGRHVFDRLGYLAGSDKDRLADINDALRDEGVRAVITTMGASGECVRHCPQLASNCR
jgi:muramoyltetrapeptide carboxypeptidase